MEVGACCAAEMIEQIENSCGLSNVDCPFETGTVNESEVNPQITKTEDENTIEMELESEQKVKTAPQRKFPAETMQKGSGGGTDERNEIETESEKENETIIENVSTEIEQQSNSSNRNASEEKNKSGNIFDSKFWKTLYEEIDKAFEKACEEAIKTEDDKVKISPFVTREITTEGADQIEIDTEIGRNIDDGIETGMERGANEEIDTEFVQVRTVERTEIETELQKGNETRIENVSTEIETVSTEIEQQSNSSNQNASKEEDKSGNIFDPKFGKTLDEEIDKAFEKAREEVIELGKNFSILNSGSESNSGNNVKTEIMEGVKQEFEMNQIVGNPEGEVRSEIKKELVWDTGILPEMDIVFRPFVERVIKTEGADRIEIDTEVGRNINDGMETEMSRGANEEIDTQFVQIRTVERTEIETESQKENETQIENVSTEIEQQSNSSNHNASEEEDESGNIFDQKFEKTLDEEIDKAFEKAREEVIELGKNSSILNSGSESNSGNNVKTEIMEAVKQEFEMNQIVGNPEGEVRSEIKKELVWDTGILPEMDIVFRPFVERVIKTEGADRIEIDTEVGRNINDGIETEMSRGANEEIDTQFVQIRTAERTEIETESQIENETQIEKFSTEIEQQSDTSNRNAFEGEDVCGNIFDPEFWRTLDEEIDKAFEKAREAVIELGKNSSILNSGSESNSGSNVKTEMMEAVKQEFEMNQIVGDPEGEVRSEIKKELVWDTGILPEMDIVFRPFVERLIKTEGADQIEIDTGVGRNINDGIETEMEREANAEIDTQFVQIRTVKRTEIETKLQKENETIIENVSTEIEQQSDTSNRNAFEGENVSGNIFDPKFGKTLDEEIEKTSEKACEEVIGTEDDEVKIKSEFGENSSMLEREKGNGKGIERIEQGSDKKNRKGTKRRSETKVENEAKRLFLMREASISSEEDSYDAWYNHTIETEMEREANEEIDTEIAQIRTVERIISSEEESYDAWYNHQTREGFLRKEEISTNKKPTAFFKKADVLTKEFPFENPVAFSIFKKNKLKKSIFQMKKKSSCLGNKRQSSPYSNSQTNNAANYMILGEPNLQATSGYHQAAQQMSKYPPPLVDVRHMNGGMTSREMQNSYVVTSSQNQMMNQQRTHQATARSQNNMTDDRNNVANGRMNMNNCSRKLQSIPDPPTGGTHVPYQMQKAVIENKMIPCINMKPFVFSDLLVTLPDLCSNFFNNVPTQSCQQVLEVLEVDLYKPNNSQMQVLIENGKCQNLNETVPLVQVRSVIDFMPQLKYMLGGMLQSDMGSKRPRNS